METFSFHVASFWILDRLSTFIRWPQEVRVSAACPLAVMKYPDKGAWMETGWFGSLFQISAHRLWDVEVKRYSHLLKSTARGLHCACSRSVCFPYSLGWPCPPTHGAWAFLPQLTRPRCRRHAHRNNLDNASLRLPSLVILNRVELICYHRVFTLENLKAKYLVSLAILSTTPTIWINRNKNHLETWPSRSFPCMFSKRRRMWCKLNYSHCSYWSFLESVRSWATRLRDDAHNWGLQHRNGGGMRMEGQGCWGRFGPEVALDSDSKMIYQMFV